MNLRRLGFVRNVKVLVRLGDIKSLNVNNVRVRARLKILQRARLDLLLEFPFVQHVRARENILKNNVLNVMPKEDQKLKGRWS